MRHNDTDMLLVLALLWALSQGDQPWLMSFGRASRGGAGKRKATALSPPPMLQPQPSGPENLRQSGKNLYDLLHPNEHKKDLPGKQMTREAVLDIATRAGFLDPKLATAIAFAESGGVPGAVVRSSKEYSVGLWQINTKVQPFKVETMKDPKANADAALLISKGGRDWSAWPTFKNGSYKKFQTGILAP